MAKQTNYSNINNLMLVISFNAPTDQPTQTQPVRIEARCEAITDEGAVRNISKVLNVGNATENPLTLKQIYTAVNKTTTGGIIAGVLKDCLLDAVDEDASA